MENKRVCLECPLFHEENSLCLVDGEEISSFTLCKHGIDKGNDYY